MIPAAPRKLGYDDLLTMPSDGLRREILDGELIVTPSPSPQHQRVSKRLQRQLEAFFETRGLGEVFQAPLDTILGPHDVVEPDLLVVSDASSVSRRAIEKPPLLTVEILSPSTERVDRVRKRQRYGVSGVAHYWIVDIDQQLILCLRLEGREYRIIAQARGDQVLTHPDWPDLGVDLAVLWR
jgi:Uma2 family endonuclease